MNETTATLTVNYDHSLSFDITTHTITTTLNGPLAEQFAKKLINERVVVREKNGTLTHGYYQSISVGQRNMIRHLRRAGMPLDAIDLDGEPAADLLGKFWPEEL